MERRFRNSVAGVEFADYANVDPLLGVIVARRLATLHELDTIYSYEDALDMGEIILVQNYNEWARMEASKHGHDR